MGQVLPEGRQRETRRWFGIRWPLLLVAAGFVVAWGVLFGPQIWTDKDPFRVIRNGTSAERQKAALALGDASQGRDIDKVIASLIAATDDADIVARSVAVDSLSGVVHEMLRRPASSPAEQTKYDERIARTAQTLTKALADTDPTVRSAAAFGFGLLGSALPDGPPPELVAAVSDDAASVRSAATKALKATRLRSGLVPGLTKALESPVRTVRFDAAEILGGVGPEAEAAIPSLLAVLKEPFDREEREKTHAVAWNWDPACAAAKSLVKISSGRQVTSGLTEMLSSDVPERVSSAAEGLARIGPTAVDSVPSLIAAYDRALTSQQYSIGQYEIARALGQLAPHSRSATRAVATLIGALDSKAWPVQLGAVEALTNFGASAADAKPKLRDLIRNDTTARGIIRSAATSTLAAIEGQPLVGRPQPR